MSRATIDVHRANDRFATKIDWLDSRHSFSFGSHYDPANTHFGLLMVSNDDVVAPGAGFETHPHRDMEIVTWVLDGQLVHQDSQGHNGVIHPGLAQRMSAGSGILHSEKNDSWHLTGEPVHTNPVHFVQMWVVPDTSGTKPGYQQLDIRSELAGGGLVTVASGMPAHRDVAAIRIGSQHAAFHVARLAQGESVVLPGSPYAHVYLARGAAELEWPGELDHAVRRAGSPPPSPPLDRGTSLLAAGDSVRVTGADGQRLTATVGTAESPTEILIWQMHATIS